MYKAKVYKIMIGAPSDIQEEIQIAKNVIHRWNVINSEYQRRVLLPLHWSDNAYPLAGEHPQKTIDKTVVVKSDLLICIFCSRLGSPTDTHKSGSLEEIDEHLKAGKDVMLFFKKNGPSPQNERDIEQWKELMEYKKSIQKNNLWWEYNDSSEFENLLREKLGLYVNENWLSSDKGKDAVAEEGVTLSLSKTEVSIPCGSSAYLDVIGVEIDKCSLSIQDRAIAYASERNLRVKIDGYKVGTTKLIVTYRNLQAECLVITTPMYMLCGNPILEFGKDKDYIIKKCANLTHEFENENCIRCREKSNRFIINHYYLFAEDKLQFVCSQVEVLYAKNNLILEAGHCMGERYERISTDLLIEWYQCNDDFYVTSLNSGLNSNKWMFCYAPTKEIMDRMLERWDSNSHS